MRLFLANTFLTLSSAPKAVGNRFCRMKTYEKDTPHVKLDTHAYSTCPKLPREKGNHVYQGDILPNLNR